MRKLFSCSFAICSLVFFLFPANSNAQYGNEWIDYNKTYWKFKVGSEGIFRISKANLDAAGVPVAATGNDFVLYRDGKEVSLYTSSNGTFGSGDYIEFYGRANDGAADKELYLSADKIANEFNSLFNDTAAYFLSIDNSIAHKRYTAITTPIPGTPPAAAAYCWGTVQNNTKGSFAPGKTNALPNFSTTTIQELYSSQFDQGEGYVLGFIGSINPLNISIAAPNLVTGTMNARLRTASIAIARDSSHKLKLYLNGNLKADVVYGVSDIKRFDLTFPSTELSSANTLNFTHSNTGVSDIFGLSFWRLDYPRDWNFSGLNYYTFSVNASGVSQYIEISNFNHGGTAPRLYDLTNNKWYSGDISVSGKTLFYIDPSLSEQEMVLYAATSPKISSPVFAQQRTFTNYNLNSNQGDYIILTHKNLMKPLGGKDYIQEYKNYRSSAAGGAHTVSVADVDELYDQFAYGIFTHPSSITHFAEFAINKWSIKPKQIFIIGKGVVYNEYPAFSKSTKAVYFEGIVPTYGSPGSDAAFVTDRASWKMKMNIGRLSAWNTTELANYLNKIKSYEAALNAAAFPTPTSELWKKQVLHIAGGDRSDPGLQAGTLIPTLLNCEKIIEAPKSGGVVTTIIKDTKGLPTTVEDKKIDSLISTGLSMITYYGHGSSSSLDYNIKDPHEFTSLPKVPVFSAFGCDISTIYQPDTVKTITEKYISAPVSGSIVSMASNNQGYTTIHSKYMPILYNSIAQTNYGQTIGDQYTAAHDSCISNGAETPFVTSFKQTHMESFILQGDPATYTTFKSDKADYYVGNEGLSTIPSNITTALDSFQFNINTFNLGKAFGDTVRVKVEHINPEGKTSVAKTYQLIGLTSTNLTQLWIPIDKTKDLGANKYKVTIDDDARYDEISEANNTAIADVFILSDNIIPVYPYNFSIVHNADLTLKASTLNPFKGNSKYRIEIDTTELFNSPSKLQTIIDSKGGLIKWKPTIALQDSVVYYWRTSLDSTAGGTYTWSGSSFIYLKNGSDGWNQSHYFQYKYNTLDEFNYGENRKFSYNKSSAVIRDFNTIMELNPPYVKYNTGDDNRVYFNGSDLQRYDCVYGGTLQIMVFDSTSGNAWENPILGRQGSNSRCGFANRNVRCFSFNINTADSRNNARKFLDSIPKGNFILIRNCIANNLWGNYFVSTWKDDTTLYGSGKSLYHSMRNLGFDQIDSFYQTRVFSMICKKGFSDFPLQQHFATGINDILDITYNIPITDIRGKLNSVVVGPASTWKTLKWRTSSYFDTSAGADSSSVRITGLDRSDNETLIYEGSTTDTNISFINAGTYPKLKLQWYNTDTIFHTAPQLDYWRILYDPLPEAALNPATFYSFTDSVNVGQLMSMETAIETLTEKPMDSMLVRYKIIDANGIGHLLADKKFRKLSGNDSLHAAISFDPKSYPGKNYLFIEANPDNNQPEQYHPNNLGYIPFTIKTDDYAPVMDVTFDGIHILDKDIVSSKPFIKVMLRDENKYLALNDTSSMKLFLRYTEDLSAVKQRIPFDGTTCKFVPADMSAGKNEAYIEYRPTFTKDGVYQLYTEGKDMAGNDAGDGNSYSVSFEVINKSTITNLLNYPNPFSTATSFVFTLTGSQIPSQFKIQILTVTGKVVREITRQELGNIHIGRNVTEYKWDGKDQFGQTLGNGVYLYRVVTAINGENIERRTNADIDKFYKNGYSKMYIMR